MVIFKNNMETMLNHTSTSNDTQPTESLSEPIYIPEAVDMAAIYARISGKRNSNSIATQIELAKDLLLEQELILYEVYTDEESATKLPFHERPGFKRLLADAKSGKFKTVIAFRRDRLARNFEDFKEIKNIFTKNNIQILFSNKGEYQSNGDVMANFIENIIISMDEFEAALINERTAAGIIEKKERGEYQHGRNLPYGFETKAKEISARKKYTEYKPIKNQASFIKWVYDSFLKTDDTYTMDSLLSDASIKDGPKEVYIRKNILDIIENPVYAGYMFKKGVKRNVKTIFYRDKETGKIEIDLEKHNNTLAVCSNVTPIIDTEVWHNALIKRMETYKEQTEHIQNYLFKDMLYCGNEGCTSRKITLIARKYYRCGTKSCFSIRKETIENNLLEKIVADIVTTNNAEGYINAKINGLANSSQNYSRELKSLSRVISKAIKQYIKSPKDESTSEKLKSLVCKEKALQIKIIKRQQKINVYNETLDNIKKIESQLVADKIVDFLKSDVQTTQDLLQKFIFKVVLRSFSHEKSSRQKNVNIKLIKYK